MERSLNHCFTTWLNPFNKRGRYKKGENGEKKVAGEIKWRHDGSKLTALFPSVAKASEESWFHLPGWQVAADRTFPVTPAVASRAVSVHRWGHLPDYPAGYIFIERILFTFHPLRFTLRLNSGALTMADEVSFILLTAPLPIFSLFGRLIAQASTGLLQRGMKRDLMQCHCLPPILFTGWQWCGAQQEKTKFVPSVIVSSNRHQRGQLLCVTIQVNSFLGKCFFFLCLVGAMASPFFLGLTGLVVPVLPRLSRYCLLPISLLGL